MDERIDHVGLPTDDNLIYIDVLPDDDRLFYMNGLGFATIRELAEYMRRLLDTSLMDFKGLCHRLVDYDGELDGKFEAWLIQLGKEKELAAWRVSISEWI